MRLVGPGRVRDRAAALTQGAGDLVAVYAQIHDLLWSPMRTGETSDVRTPGTSDPTGDAATSGWAAWARDEARESLADLEAALQLVHAARARLLRALRSASEVREPEATPAPARDAVHATIRDAVAGGATDEH